MHCATRFIRNAQLQYETASGCERLRPHMRYEYIGGGSSVSTSTGLITDAGPGVAAELGPPYW